MACPKPLKGWVGPKGGIVFDKTKSPTLIEMEVPCGQCWSCRLARSREWALRLIKEKSYWPEEQSLFITLTYNNENLPEDGSINIKHFQKFMKNLRDHFTRRNNDSVVRPNIKYFHCGEYGTECKNCGKSKIMHERGEACDNYQEQLGRPHYHAIIFGISFADMELFKKTKAGSLIYKSETLNKIWNKGFVSIGEVTFESCAYTARYIMKKINGDQAEDHYQKTVINHSTGEINNFQVQPEYITMSRNPAIAKEYFEENAHDIAKHDGCLLQRQGKAFLTVPPRYFLKKLAEKEPDTVEAIKQKRRLKKHRTTKSFRNDRAIDAEKIKKVKMKDVSRDFERFHDED